MVCSDLCGSGGCGFVDELIFESVDVGVEGGVFFSPSVDGFDGMHDGGVVSSAEVATDFFEAVSGVFSCEPHTDLSRECDGFVSSL